MATNAEATCADWTAAPEPGTVERWAWDYVRSTSLEHKLAPPAVPSRWEPIPQVRWIDAPGRPPELAPEQRRVSRRKTPSLAQLRDPTRRAELLHVFFHHELQAAELMLRALLCFADRELELRKGLLRIALDEIRHMRAYREHIETLGAQIGQFPVRDWFWERVPSARTPEQFVALLGVGFEGANLDHTRRFAAMFREVGDEPGALLQERIGDEEIAHVRFAVGWLARSNEPARTRGIGFDRWLALIPPPLSPIVLRGSPIDRDRRRRAGLDDVFVDRLERWIP